MLREGIRRSMFPPRSDSELPSVVWAVDDATEQVYEARITNVRTSEYHGYPILDSDPLKSEILKKWNERVQSE